jgi:hypothetical protein
MPTLREGAFYVDREGYKTGPIQARDPSKANYKAEFPWYVRVDDKRVRSFTVDGCFHADGSVSPRDLMHEYIEPEKLKPMFGEEERERLRRGVARIWDTYRI